MTEIDLFAYRVRKYGPVWSIHLGKAIESFHTFRSCLQRTEQLKRIGWVDGDTIDQSSHG